MSTPLELSAKVNAYVNDECSLSDLETWLAPRLSYYLSNPDSHAGQVAIAVELGLAEVKDGITDEGSLQQALARLLAPSLTASPIAPVAFLIIPNPPA